MVRLISCVVIFAGVLLAAAFAVPATVPVATVGQDMHTTLASEIETVAMAVPPPTPGLAVCAPVGLDDETKVCPGKIFVSPSALPLLENHGGSPQRAHRFGTPLTAIVVTDWRPPKRMA